MTSRLRLLFDQLLVVAANQSQIYSLLYAFCARASPSSYKFKDGTHARNIPHHSNYPLASFKRANIQQEVPSIYTKQTMFCLSFNLLVLRVLAALVAVTHLATAIPIGESRPNEATMRYF